VASQRWDVVSAGLFALMVLAWGGNYLFVRVGEQYASPIWLATLRAGVGALGVGTYLLVRRGHGTFDWTDRRDAMLLGIPNTAIFLGLWFVAAGAVPPGQTAVVIYTFPLWVALFSPAVLGARLGRLQWAAVGVGFAGVFLVSQPWATGATRPPIVPLLELLAAAVFWAGATVGFQRRFRPESLAEANGFQLLGGALTLLATSLVVEGVSAPAAAPSFWLSVVWLGVFGTAFAYGVWFFLLQRVHASVLSTYAFLVPLVALVLSVFFEGERLAVVQVLGVVFVLLGVYLVGKAPIAHPHDAPVATDRA
jgi:drug/metabolite transporter (DMT)-like permease